MQPVAFRRDVLLAVVAVQAMVRVSASPGYVLWMNGKFVNQGPIRAYPADYFYDEIDLLPYLKPGKTTLLCCYRPPRACRATRLTPDRGSF